MKKHLGIYADMFKSSHFQLWTCCKLLQTSGSMHLNGLITAAVRPPLGAEIRCSAEARIILRIFPTRITEHNFGKPCYIHYINMRKSLAFSRQLSKLCTLTYPPQHFYFPLKLCEKNKTSQKCIWC